MPALPAHCVLSFYRAAVAMDLIFIGGDDVSGLAWDRRREVFDRPTAHERLLRLAGEACLDEATSFAAGHRPCAEHPSADRAARRDPDRP